MTTLWAAVAFCGVGLIGCSKPELASTPKATAAPAQDRYPLTGEIVRVEAERKVLVVHHDEIKDYMPAMTMEFLVSTGDIAVAKPGMKIRAEMVTSKDGNFRLEKIWPNEKAAAETVAASAKQLRQDTHTRGKPRIARWASPCRISRSGISRAAWSKAGGFAESSSW
jgi:protein SCO1